MPIKVDDVSWDWDPEAHYDIHVLRGERSLDLRPLLFIHDQDTGNWHAANALPVGSGVTVKFLPQFDGTPNVAGIQHKHGVKFDINTGIVEPDAAAPAPPILRNFVIAAEVAHSAAVIASPTKIFIRAHVHDGIRRIWLTPDEYEGHLDAQKVRLSVLGEFDDDTVGDISNWSFTWSTVPAAHANIKVDAGTGVLEFKIAKVPKASAVTIKVETNPPTPPHSATAKVYSTDAWSMNRNVEHVQGPGSPGSRPNILFLPEGFDLTEGAAFQDLVKKIIKELTKKQSPARPYDLVGKDINWWYAWVPSNDKGVSVLSEVANIRSLSGGKRRARPIQTARLPDHTSTDWSVEDLVFEGGLPVPGDDPANRTQASKLTDWHALYSPAISATRAKRFPQWLKLRDRTLVNEIDTAFGIGVGKRPNVSVATATLLTPNQRRLSDKDFDRFLVNLSFPGKLGMPADATLGRTWSTGNSGVVAKGKDAGLVCFVVRTSRTAGSNRNEEFFATALTDESEHSLKSTGRKELDVSASKIPNNVSLGLLATIAHELAHGIALDDEYGSAFRFPDASIDDSRKKGNVQAHKDVDLGGGLDGNNIKWRWLRIRVAAVLTAAPTRLNPGATPARLELTLPPFGAGGFGHLDKVRLRTRPLLPTHRQSEIFTVTDPPQNTMVDATLKIEQDVAAPSRKQNSRRQHRVRPEA